MKLKHKKIVIIIAIATLALSFLILLIVPTGGSNTKDASTADLALNKNEEINKLIADYYTAKKTVNIEKMGELVSDPNQVNRDILTSMAKYVDDYQNINCYVIKNEESNEYRVYAKYDMKLKNINSLSPCLDAFYVTVASDGKYLIYLSALDEVQDNFIEAADKNDAIIKLKDDVNKAFKDVIDKDEACKKFYDQMDKQIQSAAASSSVIQQAASAAAAAGGSENAAN